MGNLLHGKAVLAEHCACEAIRRRFVAELHGLIDLIVVIREYRKHGAENLLLHRLEVRICCFDDGGLHEVADGLVPLAAHNDLGVRGLLRILQITVDVIPRRLVDNRVDEAGMVAHIAHLHLAGIFLHNLQNCRPQTLGYIHTRCRRALLALELERAAECRGCHSLHIGRRMHEDEVLAAGLAHEARIAHVLAQILACLPPEAVERARAAGEMNAGEPLAGRCHLADERAAARQEIDHAVRKTGLLVQLHQIIIRECRCR